MADMIQDIDYKRLNEQASLLYDVAYAKGYSAGEEQGRTQTAAQHSLDKLKTVGRLAGLAAEMRNKNDDDAALHNALLATCRRILGGVSTFNAGEHIRKAMDACGTGGFVPQIDVLISNAEQAEAIIQQHA